MRSFSECYSCIMQQSLNAARMADADESLQVDILRQVAGVLAQVNPDLSPSHIVDLTNSLICRATGVLDPYLTVRIAGLDQALAVQPRLRELIQGARDPFEIAVRLAIAGNIIDVIPGHTYDLWTVIKQALKQPITGEGLEAFRIAVLSSASILYLADNAGETVFDRFLVEQLERPTIYAVKSGPILNDATYKDALSAGLDRVAKVVRTGSQGPGTILSNCSPEFLDIYRSADLVIAKGQANYETLDTQGERVFFLMKVKCPIIGREAGASVGDLLIRRGTCLTQQ